MDEAEQTLEVQGEASPIPWQFELALWVPAFFVVVWFLHRLFNGVWADARPPSSALQDTPDPPGGDDPRT